MHVRLHYLMKTLMFGLLILRTMMLFPTPTSLIFSLSGSSGHSLAIRSSAAVTPEAVIFSGRDKVVRAVDPKTGDELWKFTARRGIDSSPVVVGSRVYFGTGDGRLYGLNRKTKAVEWQYETGGSFIGSPAVASGRLIIANTDGNVYCFGVK